MINNQVSRQAGLRPTETRSKTSRPIDRKIKSEASVCAGADQNKGFLGMTVFRRERWREENVFSTMKDNFCLLEKC